MSSHGSLEKGGRRQKRRRADGSRGWGGEKERERESDAMLLDLKMNGAKKCRRSAETGEGRETFSPRAAGRNQPRRHPDFNPLTLTLDF